LGSTEVEVEETLESQWQETEESAVAAAEQGMEAAEQPGQTGAVEDPAMDDDADPIAGLTFASVQEPPQVSQETNTFEDPLPEERSADHEPVKPNGSSGWSHIQTSPGNTNRAADPRRGEILPRSGSVRGSGARGNGDLRRADPGRRAGGIRRKNPFSTQDLPPLPDLPSHGAASIHKESSPPQPELQPPVDIHPLFRQDQFEIEGPDGQTNLPPGQPGPAEDEPRYEDLEEGTDKGLEDLFP
jgi:hypothetical protein